VGENGRMNLRALIVLLAVLNLGVAAWWLFRPDAAPTAVETAPSGIARLQLLSERPMKPSASAVEATVPALEDTSATAQADPPAAPERCFRFGPFADADALAAAQAALRPGALRVRSRETREDDGRGWRVFLPAAADRASADAAADKLKAAGFTDLLVVGDGAEANSVALGRFSSEARAQQHAEALRAAGFEARTAPVGESRSVRWIDIAAEAAFDLAAARRASGGAPSRSIDCAGVR
jgi:cell division septation protein DedD